MSSDLLRKAVHDRIKSLWSAGESNIDFGSNSKFDPKGKSSWIRVSISVFNTKNAAVGTDMQRTVGEIVVQCFVPINTGEKKINEMENEVVSIFQNSNFDGVDCFASTAIGIGARDNWYQSNVATEFKYDVFS